MELAREKVLFPRLPLHHYPLPDPVKVFVLVNINLSDKNKS